MQAWPQRCCDRPEAGLWAGTKWTRLPLVPALVGDLPGVLPEATVPFRQTASGRGGPLSGAFEECFHLGLAEEEAFVPGHVVEAGIGGAVEHEGFGCGEPPVGCFSYLVRWRGVEAGGSFPQSGERLVAAVLGGVAGLRDYPRDRTPLLRYPGVDRRPVGGTGAEEEKEDDNGDSPHGGHSIRMGRVGGVWRGHEVLCRGLQSEDG